MMWVLIPIIIAFALFFTVFYAGSSGSRSVFKAYHQKLIIDDEMVFLTKMMMKVVSIASAIGFMLITWVTFMMLYFSIQTFEQFLTLDNTVFNTLAAIGVGILTFFFYLGVIQPSMRLAGMILSKLDKENWKKTLKMSEDMMKA